PYRSARFVAARRLHGAVLEAIPGETAAEENRNEKPPVSMRRNLSTRWDDFHFFPLIKVIETPERIGGAGSEIIWHKPPTLLFFKD
ncbi:MAG: hypothetical protein NTW86_01395, partial [Candidatus Sumerlaeota bacterium]|nr:hypothetical protein [Candidatus Sumerlaeota bacterium]